MNTVFGILMVVVVAMLLAASLSALWGGWKHRSKNHVRLANAITSGVRDGTMTMKTDAAIAARNLLYKAGTDSAHAAVAGATDQALGTINDLAAAAEEVKTVNLLGKGMSTKKMVANAAITVYARVYQAAAGKVAPTGTRCVGIALEAASGDGVELEVLDIAALVPNPAGYQLMFAGIRTWAAGAATAEGFAVAGVLATDLVLATPVLVAGAGLLQKVVPTADTLTATTSANWANGDKYSYQVWRAA